MTQVEITAQCETSRSGGWSATVPGRDCEAHARRLDKLKQDIAQQIHEDSGVDLCNVVVRLEGVFPDALARFEAAHETLAHAKTLQERASHEIRAVVAELRRENLTMRDIAALLGITPQRVAQLAPDNRTAGATVAQDSS